jgi:hypothetical protein
LCGSGGEEDAAAEQMIVATVDGGAEGAAIRAACVVATVVGDNDEPVGSDVYNPINVAARQRTEHLHAPFWITAYRPHHEATYARGGEG